MSVLAGESAAHGSWVRQAAAATARAKSLGAIKSYPSRTLPAAERVGAHQIKFLLKVIEALAYKPVLPSGLSSGSGSRSSSFPSFSPSKGEAVAVAATRGAVAAVVESNRAGAQPASERGRVDPFKNPDQALLFGTYREQDKLYHVMLNKFPAVNNHSLLVTQEDEDQHAGPDSVDLAAMVWATHSFAPAFVFYNCGKFSGASQPHKHMQIVPLPLELSSTDDDDDDDESASLLPIEPLLLAAGANYMPLKPYVADDLPFCHACCRMPAKFEPREATGGMLWKVLLELLHMAGVDPANSNSSYNLIMTSRIMFVVARRSESTEVPSESGTAATEEVSVNSFGFAGSLLLKSEDLARQIQGRGIMKLLLAVGFDRSAARL